MPENKPKRTETVHIRMTESALEVLDDLRGAESRSEYFRRLLKVGLVSNIRGPKKVDDL